ncbi:hypothetical protein IAI18_09845 [Acetobacteraceae bacterium H6797]|nr:hypothetical protein [Acetobacteraceae bacterium H6797]
MRRASPLFLLLLLLWLPPARAETPACRPAMEGMVSCMAEKLCVCGYERGGTMSGRPEGWRWDCGALRPACGAATRLEPQPSQPLPPLQLTPSWRH